MRKAALLVMLLPLLCAASSEAPVSQMDCRLAMRGAVDGEPFSYYVCKDAEKMCEILIRAGKVQYHCK